MLSRASRKIQTLVIVVVVLFTMRFAIPPALEYYTAATLKAIPGYTASISKIHVHFLKAGYSLDSVVLYKRGQEIEFIAIPRVDIQLQWESLLHGGVVTKVALHKPTLNFVAREPNIAMELNEYTDWTMPVKKLAFFPINQISIKGGALSFKDSNRVSAGEIYLRNINIESQNLVSVSNQAEALPSRVFAKAQCIGNGSLSMVMKLNTLKEFPDLDLDLKIENVDMHTLRDFLFAYARVDVIKGNFNLYSEVTVKDGKVDGYVKPKLENVTLNKPQSVNLIMGKIQQPGLSVNSISAPGTHIALDATMQRMGSYFWPELWNLFRNASIAGFEQNTQQGAYLAASGEKL